MATHDCLENTPSNMELCLICGRTDHIAKETHMDTNHAYRILAHGLLTEAHQAADRGLRFGGRVPLGAIADLTDPECRAQLLELHRMGFIVLHRADMPTAWEAAVGAEVMAKSELRHLNSTFHAIEVPGLGY